MNIATTASFKTFLTIALLMKAVAGSRHCKTQRNSKSRTGKPPDRKMNEHQAAAQLKKANFLDKDTEISVTYKIRSTFTIKVFKSCFCRALVVYN